jgi:hypothetical protein
VLRNLALGASVLTGVVACNAIFGVDDLRVEEATGGSSAEGGAGVGADNACVPKEVMPCYDGPPETEDVGNCRAGTKTCADDGSGFGECVDQVGPALEDCTTVEDEDCNGLECGEPIWSRAISDETPNMENQVVAGVASDDESIVITGTYRLAMRIGANVLPGNTTIDGFVAKFDTMGNLSWRVRIGGAGIQEPAHVALDEDGNIYVVGRYTTSLEVGGEVTPNAAGNDAFIVKLDPDGGLVWTKSFGDAAQARANAVAVSSTDGKLAVVGSVDGLVDFGVMNVDSGGDSDGFTLVLDLNGTPQWVASEDSSANSDSLAVALSGERVFVGATLQGNATVGGDALSSDNGADGLLLAYDTTSGDVVGHRHLTGTGDHAVNAIGTHEGDVIAAGELGGEIDFGDGMPRSSTNSDAFIGRYADDLSTLTWVTVLGGMGDESAYGLAVDAIGEVAVVGMFDDDLVGGAAPLQTAGQSDLFFVKLDADGQVRFASAFGDAQDDVATSVSLRPTSRNLVVGGWFTGQIDFGTAVHNAQQRDGFIVHAGP